MGNMFMFIMTILVMAGVTFAIIFAMYMILSNFTPGQSKVQGDVDKMKSEIQPWTEELVEWKREELNLLSFNNINKQIKKGIVKTAKGILTSIYQEPLIAYSFKQYFGNKKNAVLYARTADREFQYRIRDKGVAVSVDGQPLGFIQKDGRLLDSETKQLTARINRTDDELMLPILIKDREVAGLLKPIAGQPLSSTDRAFEFVNQIEPADEELILSLSIWEILRTEVPLPVIDKKDFV